MKIKSITGVIVVIIFMTISLYAGSKDFMQNRHTIQTPQKAITPEIKELSTQMVLFGSIIHIYQMTSDSITQNFLKEGFAL